MSILNTLIPIAAVLVAAIVIGIIASRLYTRSSQERAFVRTGLGGLKVVMSGGAMVLPIFHEIILVNRNTMRLEVKRDNKNSLITSDRLRVDVTAEFYVRVAQDEAAVAAAAQTLGARTMSPEELKALVEGKFVDALRSAAASMTMQALHTGRADFVQNVKNAVSEDLKKNGLELESVSLTGLNQTAKEHFDPNNVFDAEGLLILTQEIETRKKTRNDVEQDTAVHIEKKNLEASKRQLELRSEGEMARLTTERTIAESKAATEAEMAQFAAEGRRLSEEANVDADQKVAVRRAQADQATRTALVEAKTSVQLREQAADIELAGKSEAVAAAEALASKARALAVKAQEEVETVRQVEVAGRSKAVNLVRAEEKALEESTAVTVAAEAERTAAGSRAEATRLLAQADRDASVLSAEAILAMGNAEAQSLQAKNLAQNTLTPALIQMQIKQAMLQVLPEIIKQSVKPLENIESIRIAEIGGLGGGQSQVGGASNPGGSAGGLGNEMVNSALRYRAQQPLIDSLLAEVGLSGAGDMSRLAASATQLLGTGETAALPLEVSAASAAPTPQIPANGSLVHDAGLNGAVPANGVDEHRV